MPNNTPDRLTFEGGAQREAALADLRYDLIPAGPLRRLARRYDHGAQKYGAQNYVSGLPYYNMFNHIMEHLQKYNTCDYSEDHLAAAAWGLFTLMFFEEEGNILCTSIAGSVWTPRTPTGVGTDGALKEVSSVPLGLHTNFSPKTRR